MRVDYPRADRDGISRFVPSWKLVLGSAVTGVALVAGAFALAVALTPIPEPNEIARAQTSVVYWNDGKTELGHLGDVNRIDVPLADVPLPVQHAVLAAEDREYYNHGGFSPSGIARSIKNNLSGGSTQGASTITQQYAKNAFLSQERSMSRKFKELVLSVKLEITTSKDQIFGDYLNTVYFGRGAYGIEAAAQAYFGVPASKLTVAQGAMLASLLKSPEGMSPDRNPDRLKARWAYTVDGMVSQGWLSSHQRRTLKYPEVVARSSSTRPTGSTGYLIDAVRQELGSHGISEAELGLGGLKVVSTFDQKAQAAAIQAVKDQAPTDNAAGLRVGLASVKPGTGEVVALYGGADHRTSPLNNATQAIGQAGSTFKPFALAAALQNGITLDSNWNGDNGRDIGGYRVVNYGDKSWGDISLLTATENSVNSVYVDVESNIGVDKVADAALAAGIPVDTVGLKRNLTFVLGTSSPHAIDLAHAYATFAAHGAEVAPTTVTRVESADGSVLYESAPAPTQAFDPNIADQVTYALSHVVTDGTGSAAQDLGRPAAGKTGTTNDNRSAWFVGYTPQLATAVMLVKDNANGQPVSLAGTGGMNSVTGGSFPARIWTSYMSGALDGTDVIDFTDPYATSTPTNTFSPSVTTTSPTPTLSPSPTPTDTATSSPSNTATTSPSPSSSSAPVTTSAAPTTAPPPPTSGPPPSPPATATGGATPAAATPAG